MCEPRVVRNLNPERKVFEMQPTLVGELLKLKPLQPEDYAELYAAASDPKIWEQHPNSDRYKKEVFQGYFDGAIASGGAFAVVSNASGKIIGSTRYHGYNEANSEVEIGWTFLTTEHWGGSYNREMKKLMLDHAFKFVDNVLFYIGPNNARSRKAVEKIGAEYVGTQLRFGNESVVYRLTRAAWAAQSF